MKTDNYLTLCLEQAAKSPLHYRHGCIVVRGGKVIGQGFNDYRPGFNGGALKHGRIANGGMDGPAIADLKEKLKKQKGKQKHRQQQDRDNSTFTPFEGQGGGRQANTPLSMHSEMMAIHSALAASSTLSSTAFACEKPCFKLPRGDKRKARLRNEALKRYVNAVCEAAASGSTTQTGSGKVQVQECRFESSASQSGVEQRVPPQQQALERPPQQQRRVPGGSKAARAGGSGAACAERMPSGVSCAREWRETSSESETEREESEPERETGSEEVSGSVRVRVPPVRPTCTTETRTWATPAFCCV